MLSQLSWAEALLTIQVYEDRRILRRDTPLRRHGTNVVCVASDVDLWIQALNCRDVVVHWGGIIEMEDSSSNRTKLPCVTG